MFRILSKPIEGKRIRCSFFNDRVGNWNEDFYCYLVPCKPNTRYKIIRTNCTSRFQIVYLKDEINNGVSVYNHLAIQPYGNKSNTKIKSTYYTTGDGAKYILIFYCKVADGLNDKDTKFIIYEYPTKKYLTFTSGTLNYTTGTEQSSTTTTKTDYIKVNENEKYILRYYNPSVTYGLRFYDENKTYLSGNGITDNNITIPTGASYLRIIKKSTINHVEYLQSV